MNDAAGDASPGKRPGWLRSELGARVASSVVLAVLVLALTYRGGWPFGALWLAAGLAIAAEWLAMTITRPRAGVSAAVAVGLIALAVIVQLDWGWMAGGLLVAAACIGLWLLADDERTRYWALAGFGYAAVVVVVPPLVREAPGLGIAGVLLMFAIVWSTDIAAYFTGRALGGPKLWPQVSPKKTWSGFVGGLLAAMLAAVAVAALARRWGWQPPGGFAALTVAAGLASVASQLGDLGESALKRHVGVKDSGHLIPGHGGVMDRLDGFCAVALLAGLGLMGARLVQP